MRIPRPAYLFAATVFALSLLAGPALAAEMGFITANGVDVRHDPSEKADGIVKAYVGQAVTVDDFKDGWVHISFKTKRGADEMKIEGWLLKKHVRARSRYGFWFERDGSAGSGGGSAVADSGGSGGDSGGDDWGGDGGSGGDSGGGDDWGGDGGSGGDSGGGDDWGGDSGGGDDWGGDSGDSGGGDTFADAGNSGGGDGDGWGEGGGDSGGGDGWGDSGASGDSGGGDGWGDSGGTETAGAKGGDTTIDKPKKPRGSGGDSTLPTGLATAAGLGITLNRYTLTSSASTPVDTGFASPYVGAEGHIAYYFLPYLGAGVGFGAGVGSLSAEFGPPISKSVQGIKTNVNKVNADLLARYKLGPVIAKANVGFHMVDLQVNPILDDNGVLLFMNSNRYLGGVIGAGVDFPLMDNKLVIGAGGQFWLAPSLTEGVANSTGTDSNTSGFGFSTGVQYQLNDQLGAGASFIYQGFKSAWAGDGNRFAEAVTAASSSDTFMTIALTGAYAF